jgi:protease PrsW
MGRRCVCGASQIHIILWLGVPIAVQWRPDKGVEIAVSFEPILLTPQKEQKEVYPFGRVWRAALIEVGVLLLVTAATALVIRFVPLRLGDSQRRVIGLGYALLPFALWVLLAYGGERRSLQPRSRLFTVAILSALAANAIGLPLVERLFAVSEWLTTAPGTTRIVGYMLTVGITQEFLKYAAIRYSVWPGCFRIRSDGIAYAMAAAIGYATVTNLNFAFDVTATPATYALRIAETTLSQFAIGTIVGYFLSELKLTRNTGIFWLPGGLLLAALLTGLSIVFRGGLVVGGISATATGSNALQGLGVAVFLVVALFSTFYFLITNADERAQLRSRPEFLP